MNIGLIKEVIMVTRHWFYVCALVVIGLIIGLSFLWLPVLWFLILFAPLILLGLFDITQTTRNILRNYPVWGHWRYVMLMIRPMIRAYFVESNQEGRPFSREDRFLVYERAGQTLDTLPFGTQRDVHAVGFEWMMHSLHPKTVNPEASRITIGGDACKQPYSASRLNISAMSFGALSKRAIRALNRGAKQGNFYHNTGEGGLSQYHLREGGDVVWQIGTANFGARKKDGTLDDEMFKDKASHEQVKMIEIKLSQGAKPSHGGILPAAKITKEIAHIRGVEMGEDCVSPPVNPEFNSPRGLMNFVQRLRELSGGKPVGFKLCIGHWTEFMGICKAMLETDIYPDFITVDGAEGGTGAAPLEFSNFLGTPLNEGIIFVNNCLVGINKRDKIRVIASGKVITGFDLAVKLALGADLCNSARGMMFALGCVQSVRCNTNTCPTGIATQDPYRAYAINVKEKAPRVHHFHDATVESFLDMLGAAGLECPDDLLPSHIYRRVNEAEVRHYDEIYTYLEPGQLISGKNLSPHFQAAWQNADVDTF
jgi:glutamate synthase domain-containing protein 2